jgi:hypothetical protein
MSFRIIARGASFVLRINESYDINDIQRVSRNTWDSLFTKEFTEKLYLNGHSVGCFGENFWIFGFRVVLKLSISCVDALEREYLRAIEAGMPYHYVEDV